MNGDLLENEKQDNSTLDNLMEGFQLIGHDWRFLYVNDVIVKQCKCIREEMLGRTFMEIYPGIEDSAFFETLKSCMKERCSKNFEDEFVFPDMSVGWFEFRIEAVPEGLFILSIDISERRKLEMERQAYMKGLEEMIYMTSHQLRQPITNMAGLLMLLEGKTRSAEESMRIIGYMRESIKALDAFTEELTQFINKLQKRANG
jgi:signal transduction histidine kinase